MAKWKLAIIGAGKIARDQHVPALTRSDAFDLAASADPHASLPGVPAFATLQNLLAAHPDLDSVAICTPPQYRGAIARAALQAGLHVLLEKPPCATVTEAANLQTLAQSSGCTLFAAWHSRFAPAVADAAAWLSGRTIIRVAISWREDARRWHPGQHWLWQAGGMGVFDPGVNALSIATAILPPFAWSKAEFHVPANQQAPVVAMLKGQFENGAAIAAEFNFLHPGAPEWTITADTQDGSNLQLSSGGHALSLNGSAVPVSAAREYDQVYARFAQLIATRSTDSDLRPLQLTCDAFAIASICTAPPFDPDQSAP